MRYLKLLMLVSCLCVTATAAADSIEALLAAEKAPAGVVFEIVSGDEDILPKLLAEVLSDIEKLRTRFPGLPVAVVSHGQEQFALTAKNQDESPELHAIARKMVTDENVDLHVCGTYASWHGVEPEDFPDYVDVSPAGPAQINDYRALGYVVILLP